VILVTVGTSLPHDELIRTLDQLVESGMIRDEVWAQIGAGSYIPKHLKWFRFAKSLDKLYDRADVIVSNCGAGTILENAINGRRLVAVQNPDMRGGHEWELVEKMEKGGHIIWCKTLKDLYDCINKALSISFAVFTPDKLDVAKLFTALKQKSRHSG
jgi:UDP-N-acetylglucosamine transferase subunit ALG13